MPIIMDWEVAEAAEEGPRRAGRGGGLFAVKPLLTLRSSQMPSPLSTPRTAGPAETWLRRKTPSRIDDSPCLECESNGARRCRQWRYASANFWSRKFRLDAYGPGRVHPVRGKGPGVRAGLLTTRFMEGTPEPYPQ